MGAKKPVGKKAATKKAAAKKVIATKAAKKPPPTRAASARSRSSPATPGPKANDPTGVDAVLAAVDPGVRPLAQAIRRAILRGVPGAGEGVKWNSASFRLGDAWFATVDARRPGRVLLVLHRGAAKGTGPSLRGTLDEGDGRLRWHDAQRASMTFTTDAEFAEAKAWFARVVRAWAKGG